MLASELTPGQCFTVDPPDPEGPIRVCLTNDETNGIRWGFPGNDRFWSTMGARCEVLLVVHLLKTRGGTACGVDDHADGGSDADINAVTCVACERAHDAREGT